MSERPWRPLKMRLHLPNGVHARFIGQGLARKMRAAWVATVRLSFEAARDERGEYREYRTDGDALRTAMANSRG